VHIYRSIHFKEPDMEEKKAELDRALSETIPNMLKMVEKLVEHK
jgi:hypothetical protein